MSTTSYRLNLLGDPSLSEADGTPLSLSRKQFALVARLFGADLEPVSRGELSRLLWPRAEPAQARHSLSQALYIIKRGAPGLLESDPEHVRAGSASCDAVLFREAVAASHWVTAAELYTGPFLGGFAIGDAPSFSHWRDEVRAHLTGLAERTAERLFEGLRWPDLHRLTGVLIEQGNLSETVIRSHVAALTHEHGLEAAQSFLAHTPEAAALDIEPLMPGPGQPSAAGKRPHPFVGRSELMAQLGRLFEQAVGGKPAVALLRGEPGIGKTALADRYCRYLALKGARVLSAVGQVSEQNVPHGIVEQWLQDVSARDWAQLSDQPWMSVIRHVFPSVPGHTEQPLADIDAIGDRRLLESLRRLFTDLTYQKPLVLAIDDLHLADPASLGLLRYLFKPRLAGPTLALGTIRSEALRDLPHLRDWKVARQFEIQALTTEEVRDWIESIQVDSKSVSQLADTLFRRTGGNPLLISALLDEGGATDTSGEPPPSIVEFYRPRIGSCSREARRLLAAISIVGDPQPWEHLAEIAGLTPSQCAEASSELEGLNWIISDGDALGLRHSLLGQAAISLLSNLERKAFHGRAARLLVAGGHSTHAIVAVTHDLAGNREAAFAAAVQAAEACRTLHAHKEREYFLKIALGNAGTSAVEADVRIQLAELYLSQRRLPMAVDVLNMEAVGRLTGEIKRKASITRLQALAEMTGDTEVLRILWEKAQEAAGDLPPPVVAESYTRISGVAYDLGLDEMAAEVAELILKSFSELRKTVQQAQKLLTPIALLGLVTGVERGMRRLETLPTPDEESPLYSARYNLSKGSLHVALGQLIEAERLFAIALGITERYALYDNIHALHNNLGVCLLEQGRFDEAKMALQSALEFAAETSPSEKSTAQDNLSLLAYESGAYEEGLQNAASLLAAQEIHGWRAILDLWAVVGLCSLEIGDLTQAREAEREIHAHTPRSGQLGNDMSYVHIFLARMLASRNQSDVALRSLQLAVQNYRPRNRLAAARMELEKFRLQLKTGIDCTADIDALLADLRGSGAVPLIERAEGLQTRAGLKRR